MDKMRVLNFPCNFGNIADSLIRDRIVCRILGGTDLTWINPCRWGERKGSLDKQPKP